MPEKIRLKKGLKQRHVNMIALGGIIGSSYFVGTGYIVSQMGPSACLAYILGGILTYLTMACFTELIVAKPCQGSFINYTKMLISPAISCGVGWSYWISWVVFVASECIASGILLKHFFPSIDIRLWIVLIAILISFVNLLHVKAFGEVEFWLSSIKLVLIFGFSLCAIFIFFGLIGYDKGEVIGTKYLFENGGFFPKGVWIFLANLVIMISSFQGTEIIGITASEMKNPAESVPKALKDISVRVLAIYLLPTFLLVLIFPWDQANLEGSIFASALTRHGLEHLGHLFSFLIIAGSLSCSNSGLYSSIRSLHALSCKKLAPAGLQVVNHQGVPVKATLVTLAAVWFVLIVAFFFPTAPFYANLLALTGFAGSITWIAICICQYYFRKKALKSADMEKKLLYKIPFFPYLSLFSIWGQIFCLCILLASPELRYSFYFGIPSFILPILIYKLFEYRTKKFKTP